MKPITEDTIIGLYPDAYAWEEDELEEIYISYVRIGDELLGFLRDGSGCTYTKV